MFEVSPFALPVTDGEDDKTKPLWWVEVEDLSRALCGALFLALPLHFTLEMWERARVIPPWMLIVILVATYFLNVGYAFFSGYKGKVARQNPWLDAVSSMGIGAVASAITLLLIDQLTYQMTPQIVMSCIALEMVPTSFGASLAKSQLGAGNDDEEEDLTDRWSRDKTKILGSLLGASIFSFNIAATQEPILISTSIQPLQLIGIVVFSLFVSYLMVFMTGFIDNGEPDAGEIMGPQWAETVICYALSLLVSAVLLWMFGYLTPSTPPAMALPWVVVLGYATTLGGAAGRLVL